MESDEYSGFVIVAEPYLLASGEWAFRGRIMKHKGNSVTMMDLPDSRETFADERMATANCLIYGRQRIDGEVPECSVAEL